MSATMDVDNFSKYFNNAPVFFIEGRQHPIEVLLSENMFGTYITVVLSVGRLFQMFYLSEPQKDYIHASLVTVFQIHQEDIP